MIARSWLVILFVMLGVSIVQIGWRVVLDQTGPRAQILREIYTWSSETGSPREPAARLVDIILPAGVAGAVIGRWVKLKSTRVMAACSIAIGVLLTALTFLYPHIWSDLWWREQPYDGRWRVATLDFVMGAAICQLLTFNFSPKARRAAGDG